MVLIFTSFNTYAQTLKQNNLLTIQNRQVTFGVSGFTFGGSVVSGAQKALASVDNEVQSPLFPVANMNFTQNMNGWSFGRGYLLLKDSAILYNSPLYVQGTGRHDFNLTVTNNDALGSAFSIALVTVTVDPNFNLTGIPQAAPSNWACSPSCTVTGNTLGWAASPISGGGAIAPQTSQQFTWTARVPQVPGPYFHTVTLYWVASLALPYVDSGTGTTNSTVVTSGEGRVAVTNMQAAPAGAVPGGATGGFDPIATQTSSGSGPGSLFANFQPTFNGAPLVTGQQLTAEMNFTSVFYLDSLTASDILAGSCCALSWSSSLDQLTSIPNPIVNATIFLVRESPRTALKLDSYDPTLVNNFGPTGWKERNVAFQPAAGFWGVGRYDLVLELRSTMPGESPPSPIYPPLLLMHFDDFGLKLGMNDDTFYCCVSPNGVFAIASSVPASQLQSLSLTASLAGASAPGSTANVTASLYLEDMSRSTASNPVWVQFNQVTFTSIAGLAVQVPFSSAPLYIGDGSLCPGGTPGQPTICVRIYAISPSAFPNLTGSLSLLLQTENLLQVVATVLNNSTSPIHIVSMYVAGPNGVTQFDSTFSAPNNLNCPFGAPNGLSCWLNGGESMNIQEQFAWIPGQIYVVTLVTDSGLIASRAFGS